MNTDSRFNPFREIGVGLALNGLSEAAEEVRRRQAYTDEARAYRDDLVRDAAKGSEGLSARKIARLTGLSRDAVYKILAAGESRNA